MAENLLEINNLKTYFFTRGGVVKAVDDVSFTINQGEMTDLRGSKISMIFQDPMTSLNPVFSVGNQIAETVRRHRKEVSKDQAWKRATEMLDLVRIPDAKR